MDRETLWGCIIRIVITILIWLFWLAIVAFIGWLVISFVEIIFVNGNPDAVYHSWNFWAIIFK